MLTRRFFLALTGGAFASPGLYWGAVDVPTVLDHILLGSSDLDGGITFVKEHAGVTPLSGGVHPGRGTRNALLSLGERQYLEIIAPDPAQPGSPDPYGLKKFATPRLVGWAAHPGDLNTFAARLRDASLAFDGPVPGERRRPDGRILRWKALKLHANQAGLLPFFIEWSADTVHPSADAPSGCKILRFELSAPNEAELQRVCTLLDLDVPITHGERPRLFVRIAGPGWQAHGASVVIPVWRGPALSGPGEGSKPLVFASPFLGDPRASRSGITETVGMRRSSGRPCSLAEAVPHRRNRVMFWHGRRDQ